MSEVAAPKVQFLFDFGSPNAYLAARVIPDIERRTAAKFEYAPALLGGIYKLTGNSSPADYLKGTKNKGVRQSRPAGDETVGPMLPGIEHRIVDRERNPVADGAIGELHVRGLNVMLGYCRAPEQTAAATDHDGWFNTGDLARMSGEGNLYIEGRTKELIIRSGFNVYPAEVEAVLNAHELVVQSAVVGRNVEGNEEAIAFVQLLPGANIGADELKSYSAAAAG